MNESYNAIQCFQQYNAYQNQSVFRVSNKVSIYKNKYGGNIFLATNEQTYVGMMILTNQDGYPTSIWVLVPSFANIADKNFIGLTLMGIAEGTLISPVYDDKMPPYSELVFNTIKQSNGSQVYYSGITKRKYEFICENGKLPEMDMEGTVLAVMVSKKK